MIGDSMKFKLFRLKSQSLTPFGRYFTSKTPQKARERDGRVAERKRRFVQVEHDKEVAPGPDSKKRARRDEIR